MSHSVSPHPGASAVTTLRRRLPLRRLALATAVLAFGAAAFAAWYAGTDDASSVADGAPALDAGDFATALQASAAGGASPPGAVAPASAAVGEGGRSPWIVLFREAPLAKREAASPMASAKAVRLDARSAQSRAYVAGLETLQRQRESDMSRAFGRPLAARVRMQHALNGIVVDLSGEEALRLSGLSDVALVEPYREYVLDTDRGPQLIGAEPVWDGSNPGAPAGYRGEGMVIGIIDSGINFGSPSFAAVDPIDGYAHVNPLGAGSYLGTCAAGGVDDGRCNDKLIGGYDFVCGAPANRCGAANTREEPGFGDTNTHGTHVASTAAGNRREVNYRSSLLRISGVAPRANLVAYDVCYTEVSTGRGLCPNVSSVAAIEQAIADGVVDALNYSISGGSQPWSEAVSLAFLNAAEAGIYVAASAGNSGPGPNTMGHLEPWVGSTAAAQHGRGNFAVLMSVTGPAPVPEPLSPLILTEGTNGVAHSAAIPGTTPLRVSAGIDSASDGCAAFSAGAFAGAIAVVRRGGCSFAIKTNSAAAAGAIAVVIANNADGGLTPSVPGTTIPAFSVTLADGNALRDFAAGRADVTAGIGFPAQGLPNTPDALAAFSSRGPAGDFDLLKPDVTAPGVSILAAVAGPTLTGFEQDVGLLNGTSMASPHHAGAAALVRQARPGWTVAEVKSALAMTAERSVLLEDQVTPADPFARGSGRLRVDKAINAGLVLDETAANYLAADPVAGGDPGALNQPSLARRSCFPVCEFERTFRNPTGRAGLWRVQVSGVPGFAIPGALHVPAGATRTVKIKLFAWALPTDGSWNFGEVALTPLGHGPHHGGGALHLPLAVAVQPPAIAVPAAAEATLAPRRIGRARFVVGSVGGSPLRYGFDNTGSAVAGVVDVGRGAVGTGFRSIVYTDAGANPAAQFAADDFTLSVPTRLSALFNEGFVVGGAALSTVAQSLNWAIYPDAGGLPAGNPLSAPAAAVWSYTAAPGSAGVSVDGNAIGLDLAAAGQDVLLPAGRYWLVTSVRAPFASRWAWYASADGDGSFASINVAADGTGTWGVQTSFSGLSMRILGAVDCGAPWVKHAFPSNDWLMPGASSEVSVLVDTRDLSVGAHRGNVCIASNDPARPKVAVPLTLNVVP